VTLRGTTLDLLSVLGPTTDVACLLVHWPELAKAAVEAVVFLGSQPAGERCAVRSAVPMAAARQASGGVTEEDVRPAVQCKAMWGDIFR
jgi:hypothetical protein